jgi:hypothetical protein
MRQRLRKCVINPIYFILTINENIYIYIYIFFFLSLLGDFINVLIMLKNNLQL